MKDKIEGKNIINFYIRVLTPVHIGAAKENDLANGIDYIADNGKIYFLDEKKILSDFKLHQYTNSLSKGNLKGLLQNRNLDNYTSKVEHNVVGEIGSDIKTNIKNTLDNKPYIPGSSLKGAIRSVLLNIVKPIQIAFYDRRKQQHINKSIEPFGQIPEDPFRYLIVGDTFFDNSIFINTKTFNLFKENDEWIGGWKHNLRGQNSEKFNSFGFTFPYECIAIDSIGESHIVFNKNFYHNAVRKQSEINRQNEQGYRKNKNNIIKKLGLFDQLSNSENLNLLFEIIKKYTNEYLEKEIAFFEKYSNQETDIIIEEYKRLLELNKKAPVIRIGQGSGFHSITGDHNFPNHLVTINNRGKKYKSRKLAFTKVNGEYKFYPMGFVQLLQKEQAKDLIKEIEKKREIDAIIVEKLRVEKENAEKKVLLDAQKKAEAERLAKEEAKRPKLSLKSNFKKGKLLWIDGEVVGQNGRMMQFRPFVEGFENTICEISYASGMAAGTIIQVQAILVAKGKKLQIQGSPKMK